MIAFPTDRNEFEIGDVPRVLVVDDDDPVRKAIVRTLARDQLEVLDAGRATLGLALIDERPPSIAIVDRDMPGMSGLEMVRRLKASFGPLVRTIVLSGHTQPEERLEAFDAGADDFVPKPFAMPELMRRVHAALRVHQAFDEMRNAREREERLRLYASEASALLAHDLNNGLGIASLNMDFVAKQANLSGELGESAAAVVQALRRMAGLVSNFTDISRMEDAALQPDRRECNIFDLLSTVAEIHGQASSSGAVSIDVDCPQDLVAWIDPMLIERVAHNVLGNALRYVDARGVLVMRACRKRRRKTGEALIIEISNSGDPIPSEVRNSLFEKYGVGGDNRSRRGMGLYFCRLACEAHDGAIRAASEGGMTTFQMELLADEPRKASEEPLVRARSSDLWSLSVA